MASSVASSGARPKGPAPRDVLFFGDSLTWGMAHKYTGRYERTWPRMIERKLNARGYNVVESALCSRTTSMDDTGENEWLVGGEPHDFNGIKHFMPEFLSHECRAVVLLLGTNDLKVRIRAQNKFRNRDAMAIANSCAKIGLLAKQAHDSMPRLKDHPFTVVLVAPPVVKLNQHSRDLGYDETSVRISHDFPEAYRRVCAQHGFEFVEVKGMDMSKSVDGVHVTPEATRQIADAVWETLSRVLERRTPLPSYGPPDTDRDSESDDEKQKNSGATKGARKASDGKSGSGSRRGSAKDDSSKRDAATGGRSSTSRGGNGSTRGRKRQRASKGGDDASDSSSDNDESSSESSGESDNEDLRKKRKVQSVRQAEYLVWVQCRECNKWRMTSPLAMSKPHWTCRDEFWLDCLEEWKVGCGWSMDPYKDEPDTKDVVAVPTRGARVLVHHFVSTAELARRASKESKASMAALMSKRAAEAKAAKEKEAKDAKESKEKEAKETKESAKKSGKGESKRVEAPVSEPAAVAPTPKVEERSSSESDKQSEAKEKTADELSPGASEAAGEAQVVKRKRGRPPGVPNKPKPWPSVIRPTPVLPSANEKGIPMQPQIPGMPMIAQASGMVQKPGDSPVLVQAPGVMPAAAVPRGPVLIIQNTAPGVAPTMMQTGKPQEAIQQQQHLQQQQQQQQQQKQMMPPQAMYQQMPTMLRGYPTMMPMYPPTGYMPAQVYPGHPMMRPTVVQQHVMPAVAVPAGSNNRPPTQQASPQQQSPMSVKAGSSGQEARSEASGSDIILKQLIPFLERIMSSLPAPLQSGISAHAAAIKSNANSFEKLVGPFAETRQMLTAFPHFLNEMDTIANKHPQLASCYTMTSVQPPQPTAPMVYWGSADPSMMGVQLGLMPQQNMPIQYIQIQPTMQPPQLNNAVRRN